MKANFDIPKILSKQNYPSSSLARETEVIRENYTRNVLEKMYATDWRYLSLRFFGKTSFVQSDESDDLILVENIPVFPEDLVDIELFAEYVAPRIKAGAVASPLYKELTVDHKSQDPHHLAPVSFFAHDLLHGFIAYANSGGKSLIPEYMKVESKEEMFMNPDSIMEEIFVQIWDAYQDEENLIVTLFKSDNPEIDAQNSLSLSQREDFKKYYQEYLLSDMQENHPLEYYMNLWELVYLLRNSQRDVVMFYSEIEHVRPPAYQEVMERLYQNSLLSHPDPKILFHEFQRILEPLLIRLRHKDATKED
jgi:hypothetical protein